MDLYPVLKQPFEELLLKNNYMLNEKTYKIYIHPKYCSHINKHNEPCRRKKVNDENYCINHIRKQVDLINRCNYIRKNGKRCSKPVIDNNICHLHLPIFEKKIFDLYIYLDVIYDNRQKY